MTANKTVLQIVAADPYRIGSQETFARELALQLSALGWSVVFCFLHEPADAVRAFLYLPNLSLEVIPDTWKLSGRAALELRRMLKKHRPSILHLNFTGLLGPYPWIARWGSVRKIFFTDHGSRPAFHVPRRSAWWKRLIARAVNAPISKVVCVSDYGYRCMEATGLIPAGRIEMIYNCVDLARALQGLAHRDAFRRRYSIPEDRLVVAQVSWMIPEKGVDDLIRAARLVAAEEPRAHFLLVGEGKHRDEYTRLAAGLGLAGRVTFTGIVEDPLLEGVYAAADVVCQVSRWEEVFGWVIAEAMASEKPVLATRAGGIPELVEDGVTGFLVERGDTNAMAGRLVRLLRDPDLRRELGRAGRRAAELRFNQQTNVARLIDLYGIR